jgi:hypothetical protein
MATEFSYVVGVTKNMGRLAILTLIVKASFGNKKMATPIGVNLICQPWSRAHFS